MLQRTPSTREKHKAWGREEEPLDVRVDEEINSAIFSSTICTSGPWVRSVVCFLCHTKVDI